MDRICSSKIKDYIAMNLIKSSEIGSQTLPHSIFNTTRRIITYWTNYHTKKKNIILKLEYWGNVSWNLNCERRRRDDGKNANRKGMVSLSTTSFIKYWNRYIEQPRHQNHKENSIKQLRKKKNKLVIFRSKPNMDARQKKILFG